MKNNIVSLLRDAITITLQQGNKYIVGFCEMKRLTHLEYILKSMNNLLHLRCLTTQMFT
jgi:hypothetical protein